MINEHNITLIAGLGNPGAEYVHTRHNVGFLTIDALADELGVSFWKEELGCHVAYATWLERELYLVKPLAYVNASGGPLSKFMRAHAIAARELLVIHDELDLEEGKIQLRFGGGLNAHNGLRSIKDKLMTADFWRLRAGIGRPPGKMDVSSFVLREAKGEQLESLLITAATGAAEIQSFLESAV